MPRRCAASSPRCARSATPSRRGYIERVSTGVAVPVRDETGAVIAALSVVLPRDAPVEPALVELHAPPARSSARWASAAESSFPFNGNASRDRMPD